MSDAKNYAQRNQRGSDWFSHDGPTAAAPAPVLQKPAPVCSEPSSDTGTGRTQMIKPKCDSNNWFKHEHTGTGDAAEPVVKTAEVAPVAAAPSTDTGKVSREGDVYSKRDKSGSSASWFSHDHTDDANVQQGPRVTTKEGGANATRMRGESENWFNYEGNKGLQDVHVGKARSNKPQTDNMRGIFNQEK